MKKLCFFLVCIFLSQGLLAQINTIDRVIDEAGVLDSSQVTKLREMLVQHEAKTTNQIVVLIINSLNGQNIEEYGYQTARSFGLGTKKDNNGVLLIVAPREKLVRIEVGYGLEGILTDAKSKTIIEQDILPFFRENNLSEGIISGTEAIIKTLDPKANIASSSANKQDDSSSLFSILSLIAFIGLFMLLRRWIFGRRNGPGNPSNRPPFIGGGFSGRGSGGGFSGGGGSFGGGGASGRW
ncbi:MAG: TPM domain-containing protein [bacterium]|nr:TPM domain-containing protein [bacterium]